MADLKGVATHVARTQSQVIRDLRAENKRLTEALRVCSLGYEKTLAWLREKNIKFERRFDVPPEDDAHRWEQVAFWVYTDFAEFCQKADTALEVPR